VLGAEEIFYLLYQGVNAKQGLVFIDNPMTTSYISFLGGALDQTLTSPRAFLLELLRLIQL
jgi:hypothetical protein